jgi:hypothetical protein
MTEKLMFDVHVERATPACDENCPNLQIVSNHGESWYGGVKMCSSKYECENANYCANLWRTMRMMMEEKNASR